jgi:UPF0271 protein
MQRFIDLNSDMGESYGNFVVGNDAEVMRYITSANCGCGFHGGDPLTMLRTVELARQYGVHVGAHPGLPDLLGFGRRKMQLTREETRAYLMYQTGALRAFVEAAGMRLNHVKPHGAFYVMCSHEEHTAAGVVDALLAMDQDLFLYWPAPLSAPLPRLAREAGITVIGELYVDLDYTSDGWLTIQRVKERRSPQQAAERVVRFLETGRVPTAEGGEIELEAQSICVHGDGPNAVELLQTLHRTLGEAGVTVAPARTFVSATSARAG